MNIVKELPEISWQVPESVYRQDEALSQSTLGRYEKRGFDDLDHLFDKIESPSLTFGSMVDSILTGGEEEFNSKFTVLDICVTDGGKEVVKQLLSVGFPYPIFEEIPEETVSYAAKEAGFWKADKWDKIRYREVLKTGNIAEYYNAMVHSDKTIVDRATYEDCLACVRALREAPNTSGYFADNDPLSPIKRYYQLKFKHTMEDVQYRGMMDLLVVDYENKEIYLFDLKTSSKPEWNFYKSFIEWNYACQARLYYRLIASNIAKDAYFKDFKIHNFRFIVINKLTLKPLVWEFKDTKTFGELKYGKNNQIIIRDPYVIGKELQSYLDLRPEVPNGINLYGTNDLIAYMNTL